MDDKIQCLLGWMEEPDRLKAILTVAKLNFGSSFEPAFQAARNEAGGRKYEVKWMTRPMAVFEVLIELQKPDSRENALLVLSSYLLQVAPFLMLPRLVSCVYTTHSVVVFHTITT